MDAGRATPLKLAAEGNDYECSQLLLQAGASMAKALAGHDAADIVENIFFIGHQNTEAQRRAVDALIEAHNADRLFWYSPRNLSTVHRFVLLPELAPPQRVFYAWRASVDYCTHGLLCRNTGRAARELSYTFLQNYNREHGLQLTIEYLDQEMLECMRLLPSDSEYVYRALLCLRAYRGGALPSALCTSVARCVA